ncbi:unnamed protein product [Triticum aestivum]|uniref:Transposase (putative) gypsy type domain-containing protein n=1 Tax=Triticum aestivum TaxID=4565 RepID=A0A7H4LHE1_WHEAT|nr:unnamed protein product [Triticum aestivum]
MPPKAPITCNWMRSNVTNETLADFVKSGYLPKKDIMSYRAPDPSEERPQPKDGEVVIFADHMSRGFAPPGSKFFRDVLNFFDLRPQDIGPNSVSNICNFQVFYEVYLGEEPSLLLFRELFYLNRQNECANGPSLELGGISIQRRRDCLFPYAEPPSHPKDWNMTWFYCQDTSPADESPLPGFRPTRLESTHPLSDKLTPAERQPLLPTINRIKALLGNGLNGIDLVRVWTSWRVIPLSRRPGLMCEYTGRKDDPQRHSRNDLPEDVAEEMTKALLNESLADCGRTGLAPFCKTNPAPAADDKFWRVKYDHEAAKKARKVKKAAKKAAPRRKGSRPTASELMQLSDSSESEDDTGASNPVVEEVHESRRHTQTNKDTDLSTGLPDATRKRRTEETSPYSGDSMQSSLPTFKTAPGPGKTHQESEEDQVSRGVGFPDQDLPEPEVTVQEPPAASTPEAATPKDPAPVEASADPEASGSAQPTNDPDVVITQTEFVEPGRPTVLAKCSAKGELLQSHRVNLDLSNYTNLSIGELVSGYISQVHKSRDAEVAMVNQIQQKSEAVGKKLEADLADLKNRLKTQEMETRKANAKFVSSIAAQEKLKTEFDAERKAWAEEKAALVTRAEQAEKALSEKTAELSGLKRQVSQMVAAIFGPRSANLNQSVVTKLKAVYTLVEQLYIGSQRALAVVALSNEVPTHLAEVLRRLAVLPQRIQELRRASARAGAIAALSLAKAFLPELDPADIALGYPSLKEDGSAFDQKDFAACVKVVRPVATLIGNDTDLTKYQPGYDAENQRIPTPRYEALNLIPPARQHTFAPEIDPAGLIDEEAQFEALSGIDWKSSTFQVLGSAGGEGRNEPETSTQQAS